MLTVMFQVLLINNNVLNIQHILISYLFFAGKSVFGHKFDEILLK